MCKSYHLKKTLYDSSTVAQITERFEPKTVLWAFRRYSHLVIIIISWSEVHHCSRNHQYHHHDHRHRQQQQKTTSTDLEVPIT